MGSKAQVRIEVSHPATARLIANLEGPNPNTRPLPFVENLDRVY